ncbi:MAG: hypothetical protein KAI45_06895, partial [Melioribacteraceae bacterium]|nr:hypothetical protein [Melioribacteraceae bacterium]
MSWICPNCEREFRGKNQFHSCEQSTIEQHIADKPEFIVEIFHALLDLVTDFENVELLPLKTAIQVKSNSTFLSIYLKKNKVHLEFQLGYESKQKQITKSVRISKHRVFHHAEIYSIEEIDSEFTVLLRDAFNTVVKK